MLAAGVGLVVYINGMEGEAPHDAEAAKSVEPPAAKPEKASEVATNQGPAPPVESPRVVNVTIDWPVADREDGRLTIDGKEQPLDAIKLEFPLAQGRHVIQLTRDGFQPIRQTLDITSQPLPPLAPRWVPKAAVASADEPTPSPATPTPANGDEAPTQPVKQKLPVPSAAEQQQIAMQLDETYKVEHVAEKDQALAVQLFETAEGPGNSPAERYGLLTKAAGLAAEAGDFELAFRRGIEPLDADYEIDPFEMKQKLLEQAAKTVRRADQIVAIVVTAEQLIEESLADGRYDPALEIAGLAKSVSENPHAEARFRTEAVERIARRVRDVNTLQKASSVAIDAESVLEKSPDDPAANLTLGRWYCLYKRDWDRGLPLMAKGPDGPFKKLAQQELAVDLTLKPQLDLADGWWDIGQKESGLPRDSACLHAGEIYRLQLPNLQSGLKKTSVEQRLKAVDSIAASSGAKRQIDLLKLVDLKRDAAKGEWTAVNSGVASGNAQFFAELALPYEPPEEYDFETEFSRISGNDVIGQICVGGPNQFLWAMSGWGGNVSGFDRVNDKDANAGPTRRQFGISGDDRHISIVKVRKDGVEAWVDGRLIDEWRTDYRDVALYPDLAIPDHKGLALVSYLSPTTFHSAKVTEITGTGKLLSAPASARSLANSSGRSAELVARTRWDRIELGQAKLTRGIARLTKDANEIITKDTFTGAIEIGVIARTEKNNIRLFGPRGSSVIFNWENNPRELRVTRPDGNEGQATGSLATASVQPLAPVQWHSLRWRITETGMEISADGKTVFSEQHTNDLSIPGKVAVRAVDSSVEVKSFFVNPVKKPDDKSNAAVPESGDVIKTVRQGGGGGGAFDEVGPAGSRLVGFHLVDGGAINVLQPMYRGPGGVVAGVSHGGNPGTAVDVIAKEGYAVGAISVRSGEWIDAMRVVFMRIRGKRLDPSDSYESPWYGGSGGGETKLGGDGSPVVGVFGASGDNIDSIGLNLEKPAADATASAVPKGGSEAKSDVAWARSGRVPRNRWLDVLRIVSTQKDTVRGVWSRDGDEISCQPDAFSRIKLPLIINGGYDLEVEFTRTSGDADVSLILPVATSGCALMLSASGGKYSGLEYVDGVGIADLKSPAATRPGTLENDHRYRLLASVRVLADGTASIDVVLDGKPYLPHWEGNPSSLKLHNNWSLPNPGQPGLGAWQTATTFHSARLRLVSGEGIPESAYQKQPGPKIVNARWGGGSNWTDVTMSVQRTVGEGKIVWSTVDFLRADPTPGSRKRLEITFEKDGQQQSVSLREGRKWTPQEYAGEKPN